MCIPNHYRFQTLSKDTTSVTEVYSVSNVGKSKLKIFIFSNATLPTPRKNFMSVGSLKAELYRDKCRYVFVICTKMSIEQRANIKSQYECYTRFKNGHENINYNPPVCQSKFVITPANIQKVRDFLKT